MQRWGSFNPPISYAVDVFDVRNSDGIGGTPNLGAFLEDELIPQANQAFEPLGVSFVLGNVQFIEDTQHNDLIYANGADLLTLYCDLCPGMACPCPNGRLKLVLVEDITFDDVGGPVPIAGLGTMPDQAHHVVILDRNAGNVVDGTTFAHELGHYFGLFHTHRGLLEAGDAELADGTNCEGAGDLLCDTPADPGPREGPADQLFCDTTPACQPNCTNNLDVQLYAPAVNNIMSYHPDFCQVPDLAGHFTQQQRQRMLCAMQQSPNLQNELTPIPTGGLQEVWFSLPCDGTTTVVSGFVPPTDQYLVVPVITNYGYNDNDPSYWIEWGESASSIDITINCSDQGGAILEGYVAIVGLPAAAEIIETNFVIFPVAGACAEQEVILPPLQDELYSEVLRLPVITELYPDNEDDMSWQLQLSEEPGGWRLWARLNGRSSSYVSGTVLQVGFPPGYTVRQPATSEFCFTQSDGALPLTIPKAVGSPAIPIFSVYHYVTESPGERGGVGSCDMATEISPLVCETNTGDFHGYTVSGDFAVSAIDANAQFNINASGDKAEAAVGGRAFLLETPPF